MNNGGRKKGFKPSAESNLNASLNNPNSKEVKTPFGTFHSIKAAARTLGLKVGLIKYYCACGAKQRKGEHKLSKKTGKQLTDYSGWCLLD